ncbi:hypothetical protein [Marinifilum fragile]|uniref:hypothetical protein n=1 Tax=Marinifilum fragile TaxID=570161 RepID=UPI002AA91AC1|nr:hypothetical protein [Marinifilum fragile]
MQVKKRKVGFWDTAKLMAKKDLSGFENQTGREIFSLLEELKPHKRICAAERIS